MQLKSEIEGETSRTRNALAPYQVRDFFGRKYLWTENVWSKCASGAGQVRSGYEELFSLMLFLVLNI